jgi:molybdate-binding protein/DNA-binding transcriptional regulator YhcF (GntR family)
VIEFQFVKGKAEYLQIAEQLEMAVAAGRLKPHERLEPVRELAARLALNPGTVARAYRLLERQGVIRTGGRRGSRVAGASGGDRMLRQMRLRALVSRAVCEGLAQGFAPDELEAALGLELAAWRERRGAGQPGGTPAGSQGGPERGRLARFAGSHDLALEALWAQARLLHPGLALEQRYVGSLDGLLALLHGEAALAGAHLLDEESGEYNLPILRRLFIGVPLCLVSLAEREQGLILPRGNPLRIGGYADLARAGVRFVNRQPGSGTRSLLDHHLRLAAVNPAEIQGYERIAPTHLAVAAAVAEGSADAGLGIRAAARAFDLDFLPLARERYDLVLAAADRDHSPVAELLAVLASPQFRAVVGQIGGYDTACTGLERRL